MQARAACPGGQCSAAWRTAPAPHRQPWGAAKAAAHTIQRQWKQQLGGSGGSGLGASSSSSGSRAAPPRPRRLRAVAPAVAGVRRRKTGERETIPIFPLGIVALPASETPLQIFEARYRVLFSTLLAGGVGIENGLVNYEKPWCASREFGMAFFDSQAQGLAAIGTLLEITQFRVLDDGRMLIQNVGSQRFKIIDVVEEKPVLVCQVEFMDGEEVEEGNESKQARELADEVVTLFRSVVDLSVRLKDIAVPDSVITNPPQLTSLPPRELSFWVASLFAGNPYQQQALLEVDSTLERLKAEKELLNGTAKYLSAQAALRSAFTSSGGSSGSGSGDVPPPPGGPD